jgi:hypothetical protein
MTKKPGRTIPKPGGFCRTTLPVFTRRLGAQLARQYIWLLGLPQASGPTRGTRQLIPLRSTIQREERESLRARGIINLISPDILVVW